jgi:FkbM family methyltransferase
MNDMESYSQYQQDILLDHHIFKGYMNGIFVDVGSHDGITYNNTCRFERLYKWVGINIEPHPQVYEKLVINRPDCININKAISVTSGFQSFYMNSGYTEMLSGLVDVYSPEHLHRLHTENSIHKSNTKVIQVPTDRLDNILEYHGYDHVHYLSVDVEGGEMDVIRSINFDKVYIDVIQYELNYRSSDEVGLYLEGKGYINILQHHLDKFMIHRDSIFRPN